MIGVSDDHIAISDRVDFKDFMNLAFLIKFSENRPKHFHHSFRLILIRISRESCNICEEYCLFLKLLRYDIMCSWIHEESLENMTR